MADLNQVYREVLGRNIDASGAQTYAGKSEAEVRRILERSDEKRFLDERATKGVGSFEDFEKRWGGVTGGGAAPRNLYDQYARQGMSLNEMLYHGERTPLRTRSFIDAAIKRGTDWYADGHGVDERFQATKGGDYVILREGQRVSSEYEDVTEQLGGWVPEGMRAYVDKGRGGSGLLGVADRALGTNLSGLADKWIPNEAKTVGDLYTLNLGTRLVGGEAMHRDSTDVIQERFGVNRENWDMYADVAATAVVSAAAIATGGWGLAAIPAFTAAQGTAKRVGGTAAEIRANSWGDVGANTAWSAALAATGIGEAQGLMTTTQSVVAAGTIGAARAKTRGGGEWDDAAWGFGTGVASSRSPYAGAAVSAAGEKARGGTWEGAAITGGTQAAGAWAGGHANSPTMAAATAVGINLGGGMLHEAVVRPQYQGTPAQQRAQRAYGTAQRVAGAGVSGARAATTSRGAGMNNKEWWGDLTKFGSEVAR